MLRAIMMDAMIGGANATMSQFKDTGYMIAKLTATEVSKVNKGIIISRTERRTSSKTNSANGNT